MTDDTHSHANKPQDDFDLDAFFENFDFNGVRGSNDTRSSDDANSLDSTMSYAAVGEQAPELPFADEAAFEPTSKGQPRRAQRADSQKASSTPRPTDESRSSKSTATRAADSSKPTATHTADNSKSTATRASDQHEKSSRIPFAKIKKPAAKKDTPRNTHSTTSAFSREPDNARDQQGSYRPLDLKSSTYAIRGGGARQKRSPVTLAVVVIVIVIGVGLTIFATQNILTTLLNAGQKNPITLTETEARSAVDSNMPVLLNIVNSDFDAVTQSFIDGGNNIFQDDRYVPDSVDPTAARKGIIRMPAGVTADFMTGFYEGTYNAYTPDELQQYFNGSWVLDMTRGDLGSSFKVKYVNLNAKSIADEMSHLAGLQGLSGTGVSITAQGTDPRGNTVIQGTKAVDNAIYYWKIAACPFNEVYTAKYIPANAVYISCTVATFDFITGSDPIT